MPVRLLKRVVAVLGLTVLGVSALWAQASNNTAGAAKPPWEWPLEERLEARYDPQQIEERRRAEIARMRAGGRVKDAEMLASAPLTAQSILGLENPELLLPTDLFTHLLSSAFSRDRDARLMLRQIMATRSRGLRADESFWRDLSILSAELLARRHQVSDIFDQLDSTEDAGERETLRARLKEVQTGHCRLVWDTLQACREHFGQQAFDRFLYEAVAPSVATHGTYADDGTPIPDTKLASLKEQRRIRETGGCPDVR